MRATSEICMVTIDRPLRDLLHEHARGTLERLAELDPAIDAGRVDAALELRGLAVLAFSLFDALGWAPTDARAQFSLPVTSAAVAWLQNVRAAHASDLAYDQMVLERQQAGDQSVCYYGYSMRESVAITREYIAQTLAELDSIDRLLATIQRRQRRARRGAERSSGGARVHLLPR
ncbi:MAG: hypothetical protein ABSG43_11080 [Solirubrobacteraceae bacterium]|jgi:hypothetical protein